MTVVRATTISTMRWARVRRRTVSVADTTAWTGTWFWAWGHNLGGFWFSATTTALIPVRCDRRAHRRPPAPEEPPFAALATEWRRAGRMVPGDRDREWVDNLVR